MKNTRDFLIVFRVQLLDNFFRLGEDRGRAGEETIERKIFFAVLPSSYRVDAMGGARRGVEGRKSTLACRGKKKEEEETGARVRVAIR